MLKSTIYNLYGAATSETSRERNGNHSARFVETRSAKLFVRLSPNTHSPRLKVVPFEPNGKTAALGMLHVRGALVVFCVDRLGFRSAHPLTYLY